LEGLETAEKSDLQKLKEKKNFIMNEILVFESEQDLCVTELKKYEALKKPIIEELEKAKEGAEVCKI
jgi:hypothetical protein